MCRYVLNVKCEEHPADLLWQVRIVTEPFRWVTVACPFSDLVLTRRGRVELNQLPLSRESVNGVRCTLPRALWASCMLPGNAQ
ncbi:hypothetical protein EON67_09885, partial [archaeon]